MLIDNKASVNIKNINDSLINIACKKERILILKMLIAKGAIVANEDLCEVVQLGNLELTKYFVGLGCDVNTYLRDVTPLLHACAANHYEIAKFLIESGASFDLTYSDNATPLHFAVGYNNTEIVELLLNYPECCAGINQETEDKVTPILFACGRQNLAVVQLLIEKGSTVNTRNNNGHSCFDVAVLKDDLPLLKLLFQTPTKDMALVGDAYVNAILKDRNEHVLFLKENCELEFLMKYSIQALKTSCESGILDNVKKLFNYGVPLNVRNIRGNTPLHYACMNGHLEVVKFLVEKGAYINISNHNGQTALAFAIQEGHDDVVEFFVDRGAKVTLSKK